MKLYELVAMNENFDKIKALAKYRNVNDVNKDGWSALMFAIENNNLGIVDVLIEEGADVNIEDKNGLTPIVLARRVRNEKIVSLLLKAGATTHKKGN